MNKRGSVILHILVTGVVVAFIAAMLLRLTMFRFLVTSRSHKSAQMKRFDESALARLNSNWISGGVCSNFNGGSGLYSCSGAPGTCACTCTSPGAPTITAAVNGGACRITIDSPDLTPAP